MDCSFNYDKKRGQSNRGKGKVRGSICAMKPKSMEMLRRLNAIDKRLRIRVLLKY